MRPEEYAPSYDFRNLSTVEELQWAVGPDFGDVTGGKDLELNTFSRERLEQVEVRMCAEVAHACLGCPGPRKATQRCDCCPRSSKGTA